MRRSRRRNGVLITYIDRDVWDGECTGVTGIKALGLIGVEVWK